MNKNILLLSIILCYFFPILLVCDNYKCNNTVSNILCDNNCRNYILFFMVLMGIATMLYELERNDIYSQILIFWILIGIYLLLLYDESYKIHTFFAGFVFICISLFMIYHFSLKKYNRLLLFSLIFQILLIVFISINQNNPIYFFYGEILYILNFAFYYLYLHFI